MEAYKAASGSESSNALEELLNGINSINLIAPNQKCFEDEFQEHFDNFEECYEENEVLGEPKGGLGEYNFIEPEEELEEELNCDFCHCSEISDRGEVEEDYDECDEDMLGATEEVTRVTRELVRECVEDYEKFDKLDFSIKEQLLSDLADDIAMNRVPETYLTSDTFKILMTQLDTDSEPSISWVAAMLVLFYSRKRIEVDDNEFSLIWERSQEYEHVGSLLEALLSVIKEALELNGE